MRWYITISFSKEGPLEDIMGDIEQDLRNDPDLEITGINIYPITEEPNSLAEEKNNGREENEKESHPHSERDEL